MRSESGLVLVDPGIDGAELDELTDDVERLGLSVVAGFSTHPHGDHLVPIFDPRRPDQPGTYERRGEEPDDAPSGHAASC